MDFPNAPLADLGAAWARWQHGLDGAGWHAGAMAAVQVAVALLGLAAARCAAAPALWQRSARWLLLLALNTLLRLDLLLVEMARALARAGQWYGERRTVQAVALLALVALAWKTIEPRPRRDPLRAWPAGAPQRLAGESEPWLRVGMALLLAVAALRLVSHHATDAWLGQRLAGLSLGRLLEGLALAAVALSAIRRLQADRI